MHICTLLSFFMAVASFFLFFFLLAKRWQIALRPFLPVLPLLLYFFLANGGCLLLLLSWSLVKGEKKKRISHIYLGGKGEKRTKRENNHLRAGEYQTSWRCVFSNSFSFLFPLLGKATCVASRSNCWPCLKRRHACKEKIFFSSSSSFSPQTFFPCPGFPRNDLYYLKPRINQYVFSPVQIFPNICTQINK